MKKGIFCVWILAVLLIFAGCSSSKADQGSDEAEAFPTPVAAETATAAPTETVTPTPTATPMELPNAVKDGTYIVEGSDTRYLTADEVSAMDENTKQMAINEIYARHGRMFDTPEIQAYFNAKAWYSGTIPASQFDEHVFNEYEKTNIRMLTGEMPAGNQQGSANCYFPGEYRCRMDQLTEVSLQISLASDPGIDEFAEGDNVGSVRVLKTEYFPDGVNSETDMNEGSLVKGSGLNNYVLYVEGETYNLTVDPDGNGLTLSSGSGFYNGYYTLSERYYS